MSIVSGLVLGYLGTHASVASLTGWTRLTDFDGRFPYGLSAAGQLGGGATHSHDANHFHTIPSHTHTGSVASSTGATITYTSNVGGTFNTGAHTHTVSIVANANASLGVGALPGTSINPPYIDVIMIESDGTEDIPANCLAYFDGFTAPTGWEIYATADDRFWRAAATEGDAGGTGGSSGTHDHGNHTHVIGSHVHQLTMTTGATALMQVGATTDFIVAHIHPTSTETPASDDASGGGDNDSATAMPPYLTMLPLRSTTPIETAPTGLVVGWYGLAEDIPFGWEPCDGLDGRPDLEGRFPLGDISGEQVQGGGLTHTHTIAAHTHTTTHDHGNVPAGTLEEPTATEGTAQTGALSAADHEHTHTFSAFASGNATPGASGSSSGTSLTGSNLPLYTSLIWIVKVTEFFGQPPMRRYNPHRILPYRERVR